MKLYVFVLLSVHGSVLSLASNASSNYSMVSEVNRAVVLNSTSRMRQVDPQAVIIMQQQLLILEVFMFL